MKGWLAAAVLVTACSARETVRPAAEADSTPAAAPPDTMVLRLPDGAEVWFTGSMLDTAGSGETCYERAVEIRRAGTRIPVPLLYTSGGLTIVDDTTVRAVLVRDCAGTDTYLVNTRTGQPRRAK
jgi:hypothetical protein